MKKKQTRKQKQRAADSLAKIITLLAIVLAAAYIVIRVINWIRFF